MTEPKKALRGFAALKKYNPELLTKICSAGGTEAHRTGRAYEFDSEKAREAGRKGGRATKRKKT